MHKPLYCPKCLESCFYLRESGVVDLLINGKQMDSGRFLFNIKKHEQKVVIEQMHNKMQDFFLWYKDFNHRAPITQIELCSADFKCEACGFVPTIKQRQSVLGLLIPPKKMLESVQELAKKHNIELKLAASS